MNSYSSSGGVVSSLVSHLTLRALQPHGMARTPKTLIYKSSPLNQKLEVGLKSKLSPSFLNEKLSHRRFSQFNPNVNRLNPFADLGYYTNRTVLNSNLDLTRKMVKVGRGFSTTTSSGSPATITINREDSLDDNYRMTLPLSNNQKCLFTVQSTSTVKDFLTILHEEDASLKNASIMSKDGVKFAGSTRLSEVIASGPFQLSFNNTKLSIVPAIGSAKTTAVGTSTSLESFAQMKREIIPIYAEKIRLDKRSEREANWVVYAGLAYLVAQGSFLARLTWWDFNWDIMEPVTYFVTFGTALISYFWFTVTRREYTFSDIRESALYSRMYKNYIKHNFPIEKYFTLEHKLKLVDPEAMEKIDWEIKTGQHDQLLKISNVKSVEPAITA